MALDDVTREVCRLFDAGYGLTLLSSFEEGRARELSAAAAGALKVPLFSWSVSQGLEPSQGGGTSLAEVLAELRSSRRPGLVAFYDLQPHALTPLERRLLREVIAEGPLFTQYLLDRDRAGSTPGGAATRGGDDHACRRRTSASWRPC